MNCENAICYNKSNKKNYERGICVKKLSMLLAGVAMVAGLSATADARPVYTELITISGVVENRGDDFFVQGMELDFGSDKVVAADYNGDGKIMPIEGEFYGLIGKKVTIKGYRDSEHDKIPEIYVTEINGKAYPNPKVKGY